MLSWKSTLGPTGDSRRRLLGGCSSGTGHRKDRSCNKQPPWLTASGSWRVLALRQVSNRVALFAPWGPVGVLPRGSSAPSHPPWPPALVVIPVGLSIRPLGV